MSITTREIIDATDGKRYAWDGLTSDPLPTNTLLLQPKTSAFFDQTRTLGETPNDQLVRIPRTTWYTDALKDAKVIGYVIGPDGCVPLYAPKDHDGEPPKRRNWRQRKQEREQEHEQEQEE